MMKFFFWIAFAVFLAASIPHVAYFFAAFEPTEGPEGIWWWTVSYAIAISIDVTVYLLSWTAFQRYRKYRTPKAVWQHWLLIIMCTIFSWIVNWAYAKQFHNISMLSAAETVAPWLTNVFPFMASAFPLLGIVYTMMAETIEADVEEKKAARTQQNALGDLARQAQLPIASLRRALVSGSRTNTEDLVAALNNAQAGEVATETVKREVERPITAQFVTLEREKESSNPSLVAMNNENGTPDKLQMTIEALKKQPNITDESLANLLSLKRPASARFWRLKAIEILNSGGNKESTGATSPLSGWATPGGVAEGMNINR